jgi:dTDP-glucose pyrophosphorylase
MKAITTKRGNGTNLLMTTSMLQHTLLMVFSKPPAPLTKLTYIHHETRMTISPIAVIWQLSANNSPITNSRIND